MTIRKVFSLGCLLITLSALGASAADTQEQPAAKRSATKARGRSFNPYDVRRTRLKINGLGFFTLLPSAPGATSAAAVPQANLDTTPNQPIQASTSGVTSAIQQPATSVSSSAAQTSVSTAQMVSAAAAQLSPSAVSAAAGANILATSSVFVSPTVAADTFMSTRPPFRPPVRSPFRPPPRPPF